MIKISKQLDTMVQGIAENVDSEYFVLSCTIYSGQDPDYSFDIEHITSMEVKQPFYNELSEDYYISEDQGTFTDDIDIVIKILPVDYLKLYEHKQELYANIKITYINQESGEKRTDRAPINLVYRCLIKDMEDVYKKFNAAHIKPDEDEELVEAHVGNYIDISLQLIESEIYDVRHSKYNTILKPMNKPLTIKRVLRHLLQIFNIKNEHIIEPDNDHNYDHIILSPPMGIHSIFNYLHDTYGIYTKGFNYYFTNKTMYIYPPYETRPEEIDSTVHIYSVSPPYLSTLEGFHMYSGDDLHIISSSRNDTKDITNLGFENIGNGIAHIRADRVIDKFRTVDNNNGAVIQDDNILNIEGNNTPTMRADMLNITYKKPTNNTYKHISELSEYDANLVVLQWHRAKPFSIYPGQRIVYHYDKDHKYTYKNGKVEYIRYEIVPEGRTDEYYFTCNATLILRIQPD